MAQLLHIRCISIKDVLHNQYKPVEVLFLPFKAFYVFYVAQLLHIRCISIEDVLQNQYKPCKSSILPFKAVLRVLRGPIVTYTVYKYRRPTPQSV